MVPGCWCRVVAMPHCQGSGAVIPPVSGVSSISKVVPNDLVQEVPRCNCWQQLGSVLVQKENAEHLSVVMAVGFRVLL